MYGKILERKGRKGVREREQRKESKVGQWKKEREADRDGRISRGEERKAEQNIGEQRSVKSSGKKKGGLAREKREEGRPGRMVGGREGGRMREREGEQE